MQQVLPFHYYYYRPTSQLINKGIKGEESDYIINMTGPYIMPRLMFDNGLVIPGLYLFDHDYLDKFTVLAGFNFNKNKGIINWSVNLLSKVKKVSEKDALNNFILASSKIYVSTKEGYLLICSAHNGEVEKVLKITKSINNFIISKNHLYILTNKSKLIGLN